MTVYSRFASFSIGGAVAALTLLTSAAAQAQTTYFQTGFETSEGYSTTSTTPIAITDPNTGTPTTFTSAQGSIFAQPGEWSVSRVSSESFSTAIVKAVNGATISNASAASGTQSLFLNGTTLGPQSVRYAPPLKLAAAATGVVTVSTDVRVVDASASYGQWGINLLSKISDPGLTSAVAFGTVAGQVLASTDGSDLYAAINPLTGTPLAAAYGSFNNYAVQMNFASRTISGYFNNAQVAFVPINTSGTPIGAPVLNLTFAASTPNHLDYLGVGQFLQGTSESGYFDNYRVTGTNVAVVPEAGTLTLLGLGFTGIVGTVIKRRRKSA